MGENILGREEKAMQRQRLECARRFREEQAARVAGVEGRRSGHVRESQRRMGATFLHTSHSSH